MKRVIIIGGLMAGLGWLIWEIARIETRLDDVASLAYQSPSLSRSPINQPSSPSPAHATPQPRAQDFDFDYWEDLFATAGEDRSSVRNELIERLAIWNYGELEALAKAAKERFQGDSHGHYEYWALRLMAERDPLRTLEHYLMDPNHSTSHRELFEITFYHLTQRNVEAAANWILTNHTTAHRDLRKQIAAVALSLSNRPTNQLSGWLESLQSANVRIDYEHLFRAIAHLVNDRSTLYEQITHLNDPEIQRAAERSLINVLLEAEGFESAALAFEGLASTEERRHYLFKALVTEGVQVAPESAVGWLCQQGTEDQIQSLLPDLILLWAGNGDSLSAETWLFAQESSPLRDQSLSQFINAMIRKGEREAATRAVAAIQDPDLQSHTAKRVARFLDR